MNIIKQPLLNRNLLYRVLYCTHGHQRALLRRFIVNLGTVLPLSIHCSLFQDSYDTDDKTQ